MYNEIFIRKAKIDDAKGIAKVHVTTWKSTYQGIVPESFLKRLTIEKSEVRQKEYIQNQVGMALVAVTTDEEIIGFVMAGKNRKIEDCEYQAELFGIYLLENYQNQGIGQKLTDRFWIWMKAEKLDSAIVWVLKDSPYRRFYEKIGGKECAIDTINLDQNLDIVAYGWKTISNLLFFNTKNPSSKEE